MAKKPTSSENKPQPSNLPEPVSVDANGVLEILPENALHSSVEMNEEAVRNAFDINLGGKHMGGPTGGDMAGGGGGPAIGQVHASDDATAEHFGSREETNAALEDKVALQNTLRLSGHI